MAISNGLIAGYSAGICGTVVGHPLDSIKVLLQTNGGVPPPEAQQGQAPKSSMASSSISGHANAAANAMQQSSSSKANTSTVAVVPAQQQHNHTGMISPAMRKRSLRALYAGVTRPLLTRRRVIAPSYNRQKSNRCSRRTRRRSDGSSGNQYQTPRR